MMTNAQAAVIASATLVNTQYGFNMKDVFRRADELKSWLDAQGSNDEVRIAKIEEDKNG